MRDLAPAVGFCSPREFFRKLLVVPHEMSRCRGLASEVCCGGCLKAGIEQPERLMIKKRENAL